jgi:hypothetical protein
MAHARHTRIFGCAMGDVRIVLRAGSVPMFKTLERVAHFAKHRNPSRLASLDRSWA